MEKESKIILQQNKTKRLSVLSLAATLLGFCIYAAFTRRWSATPSMPKKPSGSNNPPKPQRWMPAHSLPELETMVRQYDEELREIKETKIIMETDPVSLKKMAGMKEACRNLIKAKYGDHSAYRVQLELEFPSTMPDFQEKGKDGTIVIEMAPLEYQPVSVWNFLEIARTFQRGAFHRNTGHMLQVQVISDVKKPLAFQEYSKEFPHTVGNTGFSGRPSGPGWYVSLLDNTEVFGPGSQQNHNPYEADANFGTVVEGMEDVIPRIHSIKQEGWLDTKNRVKIHKMYILISTEDGGFRRWKDWTVDTMHH